MQKCLRKECRSFIAVRRLDDPHGSADGVDLVQQNKTLKMADRTTVSLVLL